MISHCHRSFYRIPTMPMTPGQPCSPRRIRCRERSAPLHFVSSRAHDQLRGRREAILSCTNQYLGEITGRMSLGFKIPRSTFFFWAETTSIKELFPFDLPGENITFLRQVPIPQGATEEELCRCDGNLFEGRCVQCESGTRPLAS